MGDTYTLAIVQGQRLRRMFRRKIDDEYVSLAGYAHAAQWRQKEARTSQIVLDLTQYLELDGDDDTILNLDVPARVTARLDPQVASKATATWDLFYWPIGEPDSAELMVQGPVTMDPETTDTRNVS